MPKKLVYGKRSQAIYDPLAVFGSPQQSEKTKCDHPDINVLAEEVHKLKLGHPSSNIEKFEREATRKKREVLREKSANAIARIPKTGPAQVHRRGPKTVISDSEDDGQFDDRDDVIGTTHKQLARETRTCTKITKSNVASRDQTIDLESQSTADGKIRRTPTSIDVQEIHNDQENPTDTGLSQHRSGSAIPIGKCNSTAARSRTPNLPSEHQQTEYQKHCMPLLRLCSHPITTMSSWFSELSDHFTLTKIAEASFGEVYRLSLKQDLPFLSLTRSEESVLKIIALTPPPDTLPTSNRARAAALRRAEAMSAPTDVASEVKLLHRMASTPGFTNFRDMRILQGRPSKVLAEAYQDFNAAQKRKGKELSIFPDPAKKSAYRDDQLWAIIEMQDAGTDLERIVEEGGVSDIWSTWDVFWQVVLALAKGEEEAEFEHRDLHLGNICVKQDTRHTGVVDESKSLGVKSRKPIDRLKKFGFTNLEVTLIDYTISRCLMTTASNSTCTGTTSNEVAHTDLSHPAQASIFTGDSTSEYQYEIYRYMRSMLYYSTPLRHCPVATNSRRQHPIDVGKPAIERSWASFCPGTNLVWLHFVLYQLLEQVGWPSSSKAGGKAKKSRSVGKGAGAGKSSEEWKEWKKACDLEFVLLRVRELLEPEALSRPDWGQTEDEGCEGGALRSAGELVALAIEEGWLDLESVVGGGESAVEQSNSLHELQDLELK